MLEKDLVLGGRYKVLDPVEYDECILESKKKSDRFIYFKNIVNRSSARVQMNLGIDNFLDRVVIIKSCEYREHDLENKETISRRREALKVQLDLLNELNSPLLPEPLDYIEIPTLNNKIPYELRHKEPALILDYQSGKTLFYMMDKLVKDKRKQGAQKQNHRFREIGRIAKNIVIFLKVLKEKEYAYQGLCLKHILLLKDNSVRFLGLGSICKTINGRIDTNHKNFGVTVLGYSAPELNNKNLINWGADYATSESIGAFSLGVILHQLILGEEITYKKYEDIIGEHGHLIYPNEKTETLIKNSHFRGDRLHKLISDLCKEDPAERLTDYDEIMARLENIFDNRPKSIEVGQNLISVEEFELLNSQEEENKHCIDDNALLEEIDAEIKYYIKDSTTSYGKMKSKVYKCSECKDSNKYYVDMASYCQLQDKLDEIIKDNDLELEFRMKDYDLDIIDSIVEYDEKIENCIKHNNKLYYKNVTLNYYEKGKFDTPKGKLNLKLPICIKCKKAHLDNETINKLRNLLNYKAKNTQYDFKVIKSENILKKINKISVLEEVYDNCCSDLEVLNYSNVALEYEQNNTKKILPIYTKYCKKCNKNYVNKEEYDKIIKSIPSGCKKLFTIENSYETTQSVEYIYDKEDKCLYDLESLSKKILMIPYYNDKLQTKELGKIKITAWICKSCNKVYIKETVRRHLEKLMEEKNIYINLNKPLRTLVKSVNVSDNEVDYCKEKHDIIEGVVNFKYLNNKKQSYEVLEYTQVVKYCKECNEAYMTEQEYNDLKRILDENCTIERVSTLDKNFLDKIKGLVENIFKPFK